MCSRSLLHIATRADKSTLAYKFRGLCRQINKSYGIGGLRLIFVSAANESSARYSCYKNRKTTYCEHLFFWRSVRSLRALIYNIGHIFLCIYTIRIMGRRYHWCHDKMRSPHKNCCHTRNIYRAHFDNSWIPNCSMKYCRLPWTFGAGYPVYSQFRQQITSQQRSERPKLHTRQLQFPANVRQPITLYAPQSTYVTPVLAFRLQALKCLLRPLETRRDATELN